MTDEWSCAYRADARTMAAAVVVHIALLVLGAVCGLLAVGWLVRWLAGL